MDDKVRLGGWPSSMAIIEGEDGFAKMVPLRELMNGASNGNTSTAVGPHQEDGHRQETTKEGEVDGAHVRS